MSMLEAALGILLMLSATLMLLVIMPPIELVGWLKDRLRGKTRCAEQPGLEMEDL